MEFKDFWSINGWLCQYYFDDNNMISEVNIVAPMDVEQNLSDRFWGRKVAEFEQWLYKLDESTTRLSILPIEDIPELELRIFLCADGYIYAAYPASPPERPGQIYELVCLFPRDRVRNHSHSDLGYTQQLIGDAGKRLWLNISDLLTEASQNLSRQNSGI